MDDFSPGGGRLFDFRGEGYTLICGVFFALQIVAVGIYGDKLDLMLYTAIQFFTAFLICGFMSLLTEQIPESLTLAGAGSLAYITVMATCLCFVMMNYGIKRTRPAPAALILSLEAVFGVVFSMAFSPTLTTLSGKETSLSSCASLKQYAPISVTPSGISIAVSDSQISKALSPIEVSAEPGAKDTPTRS